MNPVESKKFGELLREWRGRRRSTQLDLALNAGISQRHLSFLESGRAQPSREMVLLLAGLLEIPLRERNVLLTAAGYAAVFPETPLDDHSLAAARRAVDVILKGLEPNPSFAVDRYWNLIAPNKAGEILLTEADSSLLEESPVNILRLGLHPRGFAAQIVNYTEWRECRLEQVDRAIAVSADARLMEIKEELKGYPPPASAKNEIVSKKSDRSRFAVALRLTTKHGALSFVSTTTIFGTPIDVTVSELAVESFFPADEKTAEILEHVFK